MNEGIDLPDDVADAVESLRLAIDRRRLDGWADMSQDAMLEVVWSLVRRTLASDEPREDTPSVNG